VRQDDHYALAIASFGPALHRLVRGFEADPDRRRDLLQEIHLELWRSLEVFEEKCSLRTWVYRVAHNVHASHVIRSRRLNYGSFASLDELADAPDRDNPEVTASDQQALTWLYQTIRQLKPPDAQVMWLYLEDIDASEIAEIVGISPGAVATRIHRVKTILARMFQNGGPADDQV
jgi:RNA polymerase sigma-70 factor (ECF subfamily)